MACPSISKRVTRITYLVVTKFVRLLSVLAVFAVCAFVFLRLYGVPAPVLREIIKRVNAAGIPVDVESVMLTLSGWKAQNVTYYSKNPDDLEPIFRAREVLFERSPALEDEGAKGWGIDFEASDIYITPSVEWGVAIPDGSAYRQVDFVRLKIKIYPDHIKFADAEISWMGIDFGADGELVKKEKQAPGARGTRPAKPTEEEPVQPTVLPSYVSEQEFQALEDRLKSLQIDGDAQVDVRFVVDARNYADSSVQITAKANDVYIRNVDFDEMEVHASYKFPEVHVDKLRVVRNGESLLADAAYDLETAQIQGAIENSITSRKLLLLTPQPVLDLLVKAQLQIEELPQFRLQVDPCKLIDIPNSFHGTLSVNDVTYCGLLIESAKGNIQRKNNLLEISQIYATVAGQEERAAEVGSCMKGGAISGEVYWDANREWFGVSAEGSIDPNLVIEPLAIVPIATNVIDRFFFPNELPQISLELGSCYTNWSTFFIDIHGVGHDAGFEQALIPTANITASYSNSILRLDPIAVMDGVDFLKGSASVNFKTDAVTFDAFGSLNPELIEDAVYPDFGLFGNHLKTSGDTQIKAKGALDWKTMKATDFRAEVEAERLDIPVVAGFDAVKAIVIGDGANIIVTNATYGVYGGKGEGAFIITLEPGREDVPYSVDVDLERIDYKKMLQYVGKKSGERTKGKLSGTASVTADMRKHFLESANGQGHFKIEEGELADIPIFSGFSNLMRRMIPGFKFFSITHLSLDCAFTEGVISSENALFAGDVFHARAEGRYSLNSGYNANVEVSLLSDKGLSKVIRVITSPITKLFEFQLTGTMEKPVWRLKNFNPAQEREPEAAASDE